MDKSRYLVQLIDVIRVLRGSEADLAKKHLKAYETNHTVKHRKMFQLYKYIKIKQIHDYEKLKKKISPDSNDDSFNKLIRRTTDRIQESLIVDVNIRRKGAYSDVFKMKFFIRKLLIQGQILMGRGLVDRPTVILDTCIKYSKRFELYDELIEAYRFKQTILSRRSDKETMKKLDLELDFYEECRRLSIITRKIRDEFEIIISGKIKTSRINKSLKNKIEKLYDYYIKTNSVNILSQYYLIKIEVFKSENNLLKVVETIKYLIEILKNSIAIYSPARIIYLQNQLANYEFSRLEFIASIKEIHDGINLISSINSMYITLQTKKVYNLLLRNETNESLNLIQEIENLEIINKMPYYLSEVKYLKVICYFRLQEYKMAINLLSEKSEIEKDKEGWNVWIRIMRLLCSIELLKLNMIDYDVESFRKYLQRIDKQYEVRKRDKLVLKVLLELDKQNYDFEATAIHRAVELEKLKSTDKKFAWNPDSPEIVLFHEWFESKRLKRPYQPDFDIYRKAWAKG